MPGHLITVEGVDGSGKTTLIRELQQKLSDAGFSVVITREPGGCPLADAIRGILLDPKNRDLTSRSELLLFAAARAQHVETVIQPAINAGKVVLCDRFTDSTIAYQGYGRGLEMGQILELNRYAQNTTLIWKTLLIDLDPKIALERALGRELGKTEEEQESRFETEALEFHTRVRNGFLELSKENSERFIQLDGDREQLDIVQEAWKRLRACLAV